MRHGRGELEVEHDESGTTDRPTRGHGHLGQWWERGQRFHRGALFDLIVGVGLVTYGIVYLLVAVIAARIAVTGQHTADTPYAAMDDMAESVAGQVLLWLTALGLVVLTSWRVMDIVWRRNPGETWISRTTDRVGSVFSGIGYLVLALSAGQVALGGHANQDATVRPPGPSIALDHWAVRLVVTAAGVALFAVAAWSIYRGLRTWFLDDLKAGTPSIVIRLGQAGYVGRGVTFCILGGMLIWSAVGHHVGPADLRTVFRLINISPTGEPLLLLKAAGLGLFGAYCLTWAAHRRR